MASAVRAAAEGSARRTTRYLLLTILGGLVFLSMQAYEWSHFIAAGGRLDSNPWGVTQFSSYFFLITGFHGTHILIGVLILVITVLRFRRGKSSAGGVELTGLYWHFVDLVWVFVFTFFYLVYMDNTHEDSKMSSSKNLYIKVWLLLLVLTAVMTIVDRSPVAPIVLIGVLVLAMLLKAGIIAAYFMHLRFERMSLVLTVLIGLLVTGAILFLFLVPDARSILSLSVGLGTHFL